MFPLSFCVYKDLYTCVEDTAQQSYIPQQGHLRYTQSVFRQTSLHLTAKKNISMMPSTLDSLSTPKEGQAYHIKVIYNRGLVRLVRPKG